MITTLLAAGLLSATVLADADVRLVSEDVPVPGGIEGLARAIGIVAAPDRARLVAELARVIYGETAEKRRNADTTYTRLLAYLAGASAGASPAAGDVVPMPLPAATWSQAVFDRPVAPAHLLAAVMSDAAAAMLAYGLAGFDDETLQFLIAHPSIVTRWYKHDAPVFAAFSEHVRVHGARVVLPGGEAAVPLWEAALGERVAEPERFLRALFAKDEGRLAYLLDVVGHLDAPQAAFALGLWIDDAGSRTDRFAALARATGQVFREWSASRHPFKRPTEDLLSLLLRVQVDAGGKPQWPAWRAAWACAFEDVSAGNQAACDLAPVTSGPLFDAAWLTEAVLSGGVHARKARLDQFGFGHRAFASADAAALRDVLAVIRAFPRLPMLMLTLERIGVDRPAVYVALVRHAERLPGLDALSGRTAVAQFQGAIALVARLAGVRAIDLEAAQSLLASLAAVELHRDGSHAGAIAAWTQSQLRPRLTAGGSVEGALVQALAGTPGPTPGTVVTWEGQQYRFDLAAAEARRLRRFRERQGGASIDDALTLHANGRVDLVDDAMAEALTGLSYAMHLGDPDGAARLAATVWRRHDFGTRAAGGKTRVSVAWKLPRQITGGGSPWHVEGSLLGLDVALAPLTLRRLTAGHLPTAPTLSTTERMTFAISVALVNPHDMRDAASDAIAVAVARGERRVGALASLDGDWQAVARDIRMDGRRRRALHWMIRHDRARIRSLFSLTEVLHLGGVRDLDLSPWGMAALDLLGCMCTRVASPGLWTALVGRGQLGLLAIAVADLHLRVAVVLRELQLPAALAGPVLAAAVRDFVDEVRPLDPDDWLTLVRFAQLVSRERIEDYVAAATAGGPLVPDVR